MGKVLKAFLLLMVVAAMVWVAMLWRWHVQSVEPNGADLLVYLVVVPMVLTASLLVGLWQVKKLRAFAASPLALPQSGIAHENAAGRLPNKPSWPPTMSVLATEVQTRLGTEWDAGQQATLAGQHGPELHPRWVDNEGLPAFVAEVRGLDAADTRDAWDAFATAQTETADATAVEAVADRGDPPDDWCRAMALLSGVLLNVQYAVEAQWPVLATDVRQQGAAVTASPMVCIALAVPGRWSPIWQQAAVDWVRYQLTPTIEAGLRAAGQSGVMASTPQAVVKLDAHVVDEVPAFWEALAQQQQQWLDNGIPALLLALAADSLLSQQAVSALDARQALMTSRRATGRVPGEAAAALLLATPAWMASPQFPSTPVLAKVHAAPPRRRDKSADAKGTVRGELMQQLVHDALAAQGVVVDQVQHLTADADHRSSRQMELQDVLAGFAALEDTENLLCSGVACGDTGIARWLATTALAVNKVSAAQAPGLVLGNFDEWQRLVLLLMPEPFDRVPAVTEDPQGKAA
ncbi:MAG: hypothetical protein V4739_06490 [Pseudomonadota bacterium]